ncbi:hypothetical protein MXB_3152, partial [Myxobolus squamalis]
VKVVIDRLLGMIDIHDTKSLILLNTLNFKKVETVNEHLDVDKLCMSTLFTSDENFNESQYNNDHVELNVCNYIDIGKISNSSSQIFHHMALLNYIVPLIDIDELIEGTNLIELINRLITRSDSKSLAPRCLALSIICNFTNNEKFMLKLVDKKCLEQIFAIPYNFSSNIQFSFILQKIQKNDSFLKYLTKNHTDLVIWILRYAIKMYSVSDNPTIHDFLINLIIHPPFYAIFHDMNGIKQILNEIKKRSWYISLINESAEINNFNKFFDKNTQNVTFAAKILLDHTFIFVCSITPFSILNSILSDDSILEKDFFDIIIQLGRVLCEFNLDSPYQDDLKLKTLRDIVCILKILSLYHKSVFAFMRFHDPYPGQLKKGNNLISFFSSFIELCSECHYYFELLPFEIYENLLMFLFPDTRSYRVFMHSVDENNTIERNRILHLDNSLPYQNLINLLEENSIVNHAIELISKNNETKSCILAKISAVKCLLLLTNVERLRQVICALKYQIETKIHSTLFRMIYCEKQENESLIFFRYAVKLIELIETHSKISYSCTFDKIEEIPHFDNVYAISFISKIYPNGK